MKRTLTFLSFSIAVYASAITTALAHTGPVHNDIDWTKTSSEKNQYLEIPDLGSGVGLISRQQERQIGEKVLREVRLKLPVLQDAWLEDEVNQIFASIYSQTSLGQPIALVIVRDPQINAFAVPGGLFAINAGLLTSAKNIDEVAGVMAHEIAHVTQRHYSRSQEAFKGQGLLSLAGLLAGIAVATQAPDAGAAMMIGTQAMLLDKQLSYSRDQEREADRVGMQYMSIAGYDPNSMADFFELMHRSSAQLSYLPDFWLTHPLSSERMSEARLRARQYQVKTQPSLQKQQKFDLIRWRVAVLSGYANLTQLKSLATRNNGAAMALATHYIQQSQFDEAKQLLDAIQPDDLSRSLYYLTLSDWYKAQKQYQQALDTILPYYQIAPENRALALQVAEIYILNQQADQANLLLNKLSARFPRDIMVWQALQRAENLRVNSPTRAVNVLRYRAEVQFWSGYEEDAIKSLLHAQRLIKDQEDLKAQIDGRLRQMQDARDLKI